jgi:tetratricopeptide (TPR) repeat protein/GGDEF domain-containing protein
VAQQEFVSLTPDLEVESMFTSSIYKKRIEKAQKNLQKGKTREALEEYLALYHDDPTDPDLLQTIADLYVQTHQSEEAIRAYHTLIDQAQTEGAINKAIFLHRKIIKLRPNDPQKILDLAHFMLQNSKVSDAVQEYLNAAQLLIKQAKVTAAIHCYERIVELMPDETVHLETLGKFAAANKEMEVAERALLAAGKQHLAMKNLVEAVADFKEVIQLNPKNVETVLTVAHLYASEKRWEMVAELLDNAVQANPLHPQLLDELGAANVHMNRLDKAEQAWSRLFQVKPDSYPHLVSLAEKWVQANNPANAYAIAMKLKEHCFRIRQYPVVIGLLESIIQQNPNDVAVLSQLAALYLSLNNRDEYKQSLEKMFEAYWVAGNYAMAGEVLDNLISGDPSDLAHGDRLERLKTKLPPAAIQPLEAHLEKVGVYRRSMDRKAEQQAELEKQTEPPASGVAATHEAIEDLFLQAELLLKYQMTDRALAPLKKLETMLPLPPEFRERYVALCRETGHPVAGGLEETSSPVPKPVGPTAAGSRVTSGVRPVETNVGRGIEALAGIYRKVHLQQGAKGVLYTSVHELGKLLHVSRCFAALSSAAKPASTYIEYCEPKRAKSDSSSLVPLLQFCEETVVVNRRPLYSERVAEDPEFEKIRPELRTLGVQSLVVWPLLSQEQVIGFVGLQQADEIRSWTGEEILILQTVTEQIAVALAHARLRHLVKTLAVIDEETGLIGRHSFFDCLVSEIDQARRQGTTLSLALLELSHLEELERMQDSFRAMQMLRDFAQLIIAHTRETDIAVKFDRSIVALILPDTPYSEADWVVQKFHSFLSSDALEKIHAMVGEVPSLLSSAAAEALVTPHTDPADSATDVVFRAEQSLAQARTVASEPQSALDPSVSQR